MFANKFACAMDRNETLNQGDWLWSVVPEGQSRCDGKDTI